MRRSTIAIFSFTAYLALALLLQWASGAFSCDFGRVPDEPAHYVTGLMMRDYLAAGSPASPLQYAQNYYNHYPKVAIGHWPPGFYVVQALWTLPFGVGRVSLLTLMAFIAAGTASLLRLLTRKLTGEPLAIACGALYLLLPIVQKYSALIMAENLVTLFALGAVFFWARYLETKRLADSIGFGLCATACILTKGTGLALALVPPLTVLISRRFALLRKASFWAPAAVVLLLAGPWYLLTLDVARSGWLTASPSLRFTGLALVFYADSLFFLVGTPLLLALFEGSKQALFSHETRALPLTLASMALALFLLHLLIPCGFEWRHLIPVIAALLPLGILAYRQFIERFPENLRRRATVASLVVFLLLFAFETFLIPQKGHAGFSAVATKVLSLSTTNDDVLFVCSDARGEGMFIAETARREPQRPGHTILRASKLFIDSPWNGMGYRLKVRNSRDIVELLEKHRVRYLLVDRQIPRYNRRAHQLMMLQTIEQAPSHFRLIQEFPVLRENVHFPHALRLYELCY